MFSRLAAPRMPRAKKITIVATLAVVLLTAALFAGTSLQGFVYVSKGSSGNDVECVQKALNSWASKKNLGWELEVDGDFGSRTKEKVKAYQKDLRLDEDGIVGYSTSRSLAYYASGKCKKRLDNMRADEPLLYRVGSSGQAVRCIQLAFNNWVDEYRMDAKHIDKDGDFGPQTESAVKYFQEKEGVKPADGVAGPQTLAKLRYYAYSVSCPPYFG